MIPEHGRSSLRPGSASGSRSSTHELSRRDPLGDGLRRGKTASPLAAISVRRLVSASVETSAATERRLEAGTIDDASPRGSGFVDRVFALPLTLPGAPIVWWIALFVVMTVVP